MVDDTDGKPRISGIWLVILVVAGILLIGDLTRRMGDARRLDRDARALETEVAQLATESAMLQTQVAEATSEALVEEWAHREGGMTRQGEVLIVPVAPDEVSPRATPTSLPPLEQPSNWEMWWELLFGE